MAAIFKVAEDIKSRDHFNYMLRHYCPNEEKIEHNLFTGINTLDDPDMALEDMLMIKKKYGKDGELNKDGSINRFAKHYIASFDYDDSKALGGKQIHKLNVELMKRIYEKEKDFLSGYQIFIATHEHGKENMHSHIIINSVNMETGRKINLPRSFLTRCKKEMNELLLENGLSIAKKDVNKKSIYNKGLYNAIKNGNMTKQEAFARSINAIASRTKNKYLFINELIKNDYRIKWVDDELNIGKIGKIYIKNKTTGEHHRLETLYKKFDFDFDNNKDLKAHFDLIENINEEKRKVYENVKLSSINLQKLDKEKRINELSNDLRVTINKLNITNLYTGEKGDTFEKINYAFKYDKTIKDKYEKLVSEIKGFDDIKIIINNITSSYIQDNYINKNKLITKADENRIAFFITNNIDNLIKSEIIKNCLKNNNIEHVANTRSFLNELSKLMKNNKIEQQSNNHSLEQEEERRKRQLQKQIEDALSY
ncbi:MAG: relaxase/mobilization nuclease domain-containing protein [Lachnospiraceae bacterium]|nr:relaxase/mobilization nuclease domain-containing protein [Lachnospiraceae bacterium]